MDVIVETEAGRPLPGGEPQLRIDHADGMIPCLRCGECCMRYHVRLSHSDARRIADWLEVDWDNFVDGYTDHGWPGAGSFLLRNTGGACVFLKIDTDGGQAECLVHPVKPSSCREWTPGLYRPTCQDGLRKHRGITVDSSGCVQGSAESVRRFESFLKPPAMRML